MSPTFLLYCSGSARSAHPKLRLYSLGADTTVDTVLIILVMQQHLFRIAVKCLPGLQKAFIHTDICTYL